MICQNCGKENREEALYCEWCGVKLEVLNEKDQQFRLFLSRKERNSGIFWSVVTLFYAWLALSYWFVWFGAVYSVVVIILRFVQAEKVKNLSADLVQSYQNKKKLLIVTLIVNVLVRWFPVALAGYWNDKTKINYVMKNPEFVKQ